VTLNLSLHRYAVLQNGERTAFCTNFEGAAWLVAQRGADGVVNLVSDQFWSRDACFEATREIGKAATA
jgi:hypothetical protein